MKTETNGLPVLTQFSEEGFVDTVFQISTAKDTASNVTLHLQASYQGRVVGMVAEVVKGIRGGFDAQMNLVRDHVYRKGVTFRRSGSESDDLIMAIANVYELPDRPRSMVQAESFTAIALHQGELEPETPLKLKLFGRDGEADHEDDYYESFFNLDLAAGYVFWNEKDPDYREPLVRALSQAK